MRTAFRVLPPVRMVAIPTAREMLFQRTGGKCVDQPSGGPSSAGGPEDPGRWNTLTNSRYVEKIVSTLATP